MRDEDGHGDEEEKNEEEEEEQEDTVVHRFWNCSLTVFSKSHK